MPTRVLQQDDIKVRISPLETQSAALQASPERVLEAASVRDVLGDTRHRLVSFNVVEADEGQVGDEQAAETFKATVYDYDNRRTVVATGTVDDPSGADVVESAVQPQPDEEELSEAIERLRADDEVGAKIAAGDLLPYQAMPPLLNKTRPDGTVERTVNVGLYAPEGDEVRHRFAAVNLVTGAVEHAPAGAPAHSHNDCGLPSRDGCALGRRSGAVRVRVSQGDEQLWDLLVARPRISSGLNGSGVELKDVKFRGMRLLRRAHVPILNVEYDRSVDLEGCGPTYRDWQNEEACFVAQGQDVQPGYRACPSPARTIFDAGTDRGNFRGVAFYIRSRQLFIVSELSAGWYRYVSEWRLALTGMIRPRFGFNGVRNPCTCKPHHHHAYWRFGFDIDGKPSTVQEFNEPALEGNTGNWHTIVQETRRTKRPARQRKWRIRNSDGKGYVLVPGDNDGTADEFGVGDLWVLRRRAGEIDDGPGPNRARIGSFVNGQRVDGQALAVWYAGHFEHTPGPDRDHIVGPQLNPIDL
ncbi:MAG TPA: hypothetical protein VK891_18135 [Euzebyales bacterium]|nr:hypothetical protein [Euzebyales bacterium]